jgi:hypothetical protein
MQRFRPYGPYLYPEDEQNPSSGLGQCQGNLARQVNIVGVLPEAGWPHHAIRETMSLKRVEKRVIADAVSRQRRDLLPSLRETTLLINLNWLPDPTTLLHIPRVRATNEELKVFYPAGDRK